MLFEIIISDKENITNICVSFGENVGRVSYNTPGFTSTPLSRGSRREKRELCRDKHRAIEGTMADFLCKAVNLSFQSVQWFGNLSMFYTVEDLDVKIKSDPI